MGKRIFTKQQIEKLSNNQYVRKCSEKSITYSAEFKRLAVKRYEEEGLTASQIFIEAGLDPTAIGKDAPDCRVSKWRQIVRLQGLEGLKEARGRSSPGRPKTKDVSDADKIERLEATVLYLKAENAFLAKLRAKRRE